ncbi:MAG: hypothetical protein P4N60_00245 [Verrucomicrobiae bacterium]|nr:hypothetical protein [Verrucomicrobiae bacterium]
MAIEELQKPLGEWCKHCGTKKSCDIYSNRPAECATFYCGYLTLPNLDEAWKPNKSKLILVSELEGGRIGVHVDSSRPLAWKDEPFYSTLKSWAAAAVPHHGQVVVQVNYNVWVILPDKDVYLGFVDQDQRIITTETKTPFGIELDAVLLHKDDPRMNSLVKASWNLGGKPEAE